MVSTPHCTAIVSARHNTSHRYRQKRRGGCTPRQGFTSPKLIWVNHTHLSGPALIHNSDEFAAGGKGQQSSSTMILAAPEQKCSFSSPRFQSKAQARAHRLILIIDGRDRCVLPTVMNAKIKSELKVEAARFKVAARFELAANPRIRTSKLAVDALFQCWQGRQLFQLM